MRGPRSGPVELTRCPVRLVGRDVIELVEAYKLAGERISLAEQDGMSPVYLDAIHCARSNLDALRRQISEDAASDARKKR